MPHYHDVFKKSQDPIVFRTIARELYDLPEGCWRPWEEYSFLPSMLRKSESYVYSEKERLKLAELCWFSEEIYSHDDISVETMIKQCNRYHADLGPDEDWVVDLAKRRAKWVRRRQLRDLVNLYRFCGMPIADVNRSFDRYETAEAA